MTIKLFEESTEELPPIFYHCSPDKMDIMSLVKETSDVQNRLVRRKFKLLKRLA
jgi:hypothetical protein